MKKIDTGLVGQAAFTVISDVMGQLSDGLWEDSPRMVKYWENADVYILDDKVFINVNIESWQSPYREMTDKEIKAWFAKRIKDVVKIFPNTIWKRDCLDRVDGYSDSVTVKDIYGVYDTLLERKSNRLSKSLDLLLGLN